MPQDKKRIAVFASGTGTNLQALIDHCRNGDINGDVVAVVSNKKYCGAIDKAKDAKIETLIYDPAQFQTRTVMCAQTAKVLKEKQIDLICLAGYLLKIEPCLVRSFPNRILNIHPALLPKYGGKGMYGRFVHEAVLAARDTESGCTVHLVDEHFDHGCTIAQAKVPVEPNDTWATLAERIHPKEHELYARVVKDVCSGALDLDALAASTPAH